MLRCPTSTALAKDHSAALSRSVHNREAAMCCWLSCAEVDPLETLEANLRVGTLYKVQPCHQPTHKRMTLDLSVG
ncbi:hypothetical protein VFPFJ_05471 [Purpureocillium lilacinum]|uniref:Uncharacterized protein n=1 Tax=Purpureocillium lilacinum TaxID=33203 RepID=A0A179HN62_PURLI|nr:hypothetical protein VFPFJ_05471 [Purpureocillium lilacinum]OAQ91312.1 hypothetical protein VFPFJ_05471 [Purpureocillium lilacinum]